MMGEPRSAAESALLAAWRSARIGRCAAKMCLLADIWAGLVNSAVRNCRGCAAETTTSRRTALGRIDRKSVV